MVGSEVLLRGDYIRMDPSTPQLNPAELYDKRRTKDSGRLRAYNKLLEQIFHRITTISRLPQSQAYLVYTIPPFVLGLPRLDLEDVSTYLIFQLRHSGFEVRFTYPNLLYISWAHHERTYLTEQSPIMLSMLQSAERTQAEIERKEHEASRLLLPRKSQRKVKFQDPGLRAPVSRSAIDTVLQRPSFSMATQPGQSGQLGQLGQPVQSAGSAPSAAAYTPHPSFLQSVLSPTPKPGTGRDSFR